MREPLSNQQVEQIIGRRDPAEKRVTFYPTLNGMGGPYAFHAQNRGDPITRVWLNTERSAFYVLPQGVGISPWHDQLVKAVSAPAIPMSKRLPSRDKPDIEGTHDAD